MWLTLVLLAALLLLLAVLRQVYSGSSPNPFSEDVTRPPAPLVTDKEARKKVLKQGQWKGPCGRRLHRFAASFRQGELLPDLGLSFSLCKVPGRLEARGGARCSVRHQPAPLPGRLGNSGRMDARTVLCVPRSWQCQVQTLSPPHSSPPPKPTCIQLY